MSDIPQSEVKSKGVGTEGHGDGQDVKKVEMKESREEKRSSTMSKERKDAMIRKMNQALEQVQAATSIVIASESGDPVGVPLQHDMWLPPQVTFGSHLSEPGLRIRLCPQTCVDFVDGKLIRSQDCGKYTAGNYQFLYWKNQFGQTYMGERTESYSRTATQEEIVAWACDNVLPNLGDDDHVSLFMSLEVWDIMKSLGLEENITDEDKFKLHLGGLSTNLILNSRFNWSKPAGHWTMCFELPLKI